MACPSATRVSAIPCLARKRNERSSGASRQQRGSASRWLDRGSRAEPTRARRSARYVSRRRRAAGDADREAAFGAEGDERLGGDAGVAGEGEADAVRERGEDELALH